ncbi:ankyrin repeat domain-containing protein 11-like [Cataglyphis hispanica]|uniref:ankyrin repeat domain-containing protein 11-like n=1 Tax=Cataglyphis hispanica TaxID=1086592 RepID=UPI00217F8B1A|nr:ankyrin repeat domain-containing protein 11-like [Cataglyphis hispanica]
MEFYDSRNAYRKCDEVESNVDEVLPEKEEPDPERGPRENLPRLRGLGDKLDCFKAKYFDENPLDNPLFAEELIEEPTLPSELDPAKFASRIMVLPKDNEENIVHRVSKKPEYSDRQWRNRPYETHESIHINYKHDPQTGRGRNAYLHTVRGSRPPNSVHGSKNRKLKPKTSKSVITQSLKTYQTPSYQNQVYEDVMGNIRNMANAYQVYEITTLPSTIQNLATADSKKTLKITNVLPNSSSEENSTSLDDIDDIDIDDVTDVTSNTKSSEIKGLVPPPKYSAPRKTNYRKYRPPNKRRVFLRSSNVPRIIAHRHTIKINKRSTTNDNAKNSSESTINKNEKTTTMKPAKINVGNDTVVKSIEEAMNKTNLMLEMDLDIEESRQINTQGQNLTNMKIDDKKRRRNSANNETSEPSHKIIYTIKDRVKYSKPKWDVGRYGKFTTNSKTVDEDSRRKEPRYNYSKRKKKLDNDWRNNSTIMNSTESTFGIENITSIPTESGESSTTEVYRAEESVMHQIIYRNDKYPERKESVDVESAENVEDETENTTNTYQVREDIEEHGSTTTKRSTSSSNSKEVLDLQKYLASDPPGYAETFSEEATTLSSKYHADINHELEDNDKKEDEEIDYPKNVANTWDDDSSEKIEEQVETPMKMESFVRDDDSKELSSKEEEASDKDQTFFSYKKRPSSAEKEKDNKDFEKESFYRPFPFSRYKSKFKKKSEEDDSEEESEERNDDYVFPWHADKDKKDRRKWLQNFDRYEYPWEKRERLARERRRKRKQADRLRELIFGDEDEEESMRYDRPIYPWERYDVPSKTRVNTRRRDISRKYIDDSEESTTERLPFAKFSSKYSSSDRVEPSLNAKEISRSIKKILEEDEDEKFKEKSLKKSVDSSPLPARKSLPSRGMLVPEDITQPPRKKSRRRKISQVEKNTSNNSSFDSKKLKSPEIISKEEEENSMMEYQKLNKSNVGDLESKTSSQLFNSTKEPSFATESHKKNRQRISKNNSTISFNNTSAEPIFEPVKKRRRKSQALKHQASVSPSPSVDLDTSKSVFTPVRRKYSKADESTKTNTSDSFKKSNTVKTIETDNLEAETSTPKTRTVEHRSKVSKEKIVTKITYPNEAESFYPANVTFAQKEPKEKLKTKSKRRKNINKRKDNNKNSNDKEKLIEEKAEERDYGIKIVNTDEIKSSAIPEKSSVNNKDSVKSSEIRKDEAEKINDYNIYDGINDKNHSDNGSFWSTEAYAVSNLLQNIPFNRIRNQADENESSRINEEWKEQHGNETEKGEKDTEDRSLLPAKFIKDPEHRLYYYVERK